MKNLNRATFDSGVLGLQHGAAWISRRCAAIGKCWRRVGRRSSDIGTGILFELYEKIMMNEVARLGHARIVLVEDDLESRESLRMLLEEEGADVVAVADAEEGAETAIRVLPDAVICDIDLPMMDGFYLIQRLRDHEIRGNLTPSIAIALTGHDGDEYRLRSIGEGFQHFMTKPAHPDALVTLIQQSLSARVLS